MEQIRRGIEEGLSKEQIKVYAHSEFTAFQMKEIREGFKNGLTMEQILTYANPEAYGSDKMRNCRKELEENNEIAAKRRSINERLDKLEADRKLASVMVKDDIIK